MVTGLRLDMLLKIMVKYGWRRKERQSVSRDTARICFERYREEEQLHFL